MYILIHAAFLQNIYTIFCLKVQLKTGIGIRGKRGRGAAGKTPIFGLLKRDGKVYVEIVKNYNREQLLPIIQGKILEGSTINTDGWKAYDGLVLNGYTHHRVFHSKNQFTRGKNHVNGIESFWSFTKRRLSKFNGLTDEKFILHLIPIPNFVCTIATLSFK